MSLNAVTAGQDIPNNLNVIIEIPAHADPVKYEVDKETGTLQVDRFIGTGMRYPCNYGYIPNTLSEDGDPIDALVVTPFPLVSGAVIQVRCIGVLRMVDEAGDDNKLLTVPIDKLTPLYKEVAQPSDLPDVLLDAIVHFFQYYKALESGKWVKLDKWLGAEAAREEVIRAVEAADKNRS